MWNLPAFRRTLIAGPGLLALWFSLGGCPSNATNTGSNDGNNSSINDSIPFLDQDGNFTFDSATALTLDTNDQLTFAGSIDGPGDTDVYNLGNLNVGDRIFVDVQRANGNLDAVAALFDANQELIAYNDDRADDASNLNPLINVAIYGGQSPFYLGIASLNGTGTTGRYEVTVRITRNGTPPSPTPQVVFFDWNGGRNITVPNVGTFDLAPFDAADLGPYEGRTAQMKQSIEQVVRDRYKGLNLILLSSDDGAAPIGTPHSTIYFGGSNRSAFAISEHIDTDNVDPNDRSIVFTGSYQDAFSHVPGFDEMAQAVGNTVAHEVGHLLGLVHTASCDDLMDTTCGNNRILQKQTFTTAPLDSSVFPIGVQDSMELLTWLLGLSPN